MEQHISLSHSVESYNKQIDHFLFLLAVFLSFWRPYLTGRISFTFFYCSREFDMETDFNFYVNYNLWLNIGIFPLSCEKLCQLRRKLTLSYEKVLPTYHDFQPLIYSHFQVDSTSNLPIKKIFLKF